MSISKKLDRLEKRTEKKAEKLEEKKEKLENRYVTLSEKHPKRATKINERILKVDEKIVLVDDLRSRYNPKSKELEKVDYLEEIPASSVTGTMIAENSLIGTKPPYGQPATPSNIESGENVKIKDENQKSGLFSSANGVMGVPPIFILGGIAAIVLLYR